MSSLPFPPHNFHVVATTLHKAKTATVKEVEAVMKGKGARVIR